MKTKQEIDSRISSLHDLQRTSTDMYNPVLQGRLKELRWVQSGDEKQEEEPKAMSLEARLSRAKDLVDQFGVD